MFRVKMLVSMNGFEFVIVVWQAVFCGCLVDFVTVDATSFGIGRCFRRARDVPIFAMKCMS